MNQPKSWDFTMIEACEKSPAHDCPHCHREFLKPMELWQYIVGFKADRFEVAVSCEGEVIVNIYAGEVIIGCPACMRKFWFHVLEGVPENLVLFCPQWPKN